jgi:hypothetical protein
MAVLSPLPDVAVACVKANAEISTRTVSISSITHLPFASLLLVPPSRSLSTTPKMYRFATVLLACLASSQAFTVVAPTASRTSTQLFVKNNSFLNDLSDKNPDMGASPRSNPSRPELPEIPGDYDWDTKYAGDADWAMDGVAGKMTMGDVDLAKQATALAVLEDKWRKERDIEDDQDVRNSGFVPKAEIINGRSAMFFVVVGLLTEYWTGVTFPGQVETMLRVGGFIGLE